MASPLILQLKMGRRIYLPHSNCLEREEVVDKIALKYARLSSHCL